MIEIVVNVLIAVFAWCILITVGYIVYRLLTGDPRYTPYIFNQQELRSIELISTLSKITGGNFTPSEARKMLCESNPNNVYVGDDPPGYQRFPNCWNYAPNVSPLDDVADTACHCCGLYVNGQGMAGRGSSS